MSAALAATVALLCARPGAAQAPPAGPASAAPVAPAAPAPATSTPAAPTPFTSTPDGPTPDGAAAGATPGDEASAAATIDRAHALPETPNVTRTKYWAQGPTRGFVSTAVDVGYLYLRPRVSLGYGHPFWSWVGLDANPQISNNWMGLYGGLRLAIPSGDLRLGARQVRAIHRSYLTPRDSYSRLQFESRDFDRAAYTALEAELSGALPAGPGSLLFVGSFSRVSGVPAGLYVFEENLRVIMEPPSVWRARTGYAVRVGVEGKLSVGIVAEVLGSGERDPIFRAGIIASAVLSNHLEVLGSFVPPIVSPDTRTTAGGDFGQLGLRYRWASGVQSEPMVVSPNR